MVGGGTAGIGTEKLVAVGFIVDIAIKAGAAGGGGALLAELSAEVGGRFASGAGGGGSDIVSVETELSPVAWKSGGSTYRSNNTRPPTRKTINR